MLIFKDKIQEAVDKAVFESKKEIKRLGEIIDRRDLEAELSVKRMESAHELELKQKDFEIAHLESEKLKELEAEKIDLTKQVAVLTKEIEMTKKIIELDADVIDVKDLVTKLIEKLPEVKISSLAVSTTNGSAKTE